MPSNWIPPIDENEVPRKLDNENEVQPRKLAKRGANHNSSASLASLASALSDCVVTKNSIGFRHVDAEDSDYSGSSGSEADIARLRASQQEGMEVMDLRPNRGSMFRLSSTDTVDSDLAREMFRAAIDASERAALDASEKSGDKRIGDLLLDDRGGRAPYNRTDSETEQAYRALMRMMRSNIDDSDTLTAAGNNNNGRSIRRGSAVSVANSAATDFWSALGPRREGDDGMEGGDDGSSYSELSESSPLSEKKRMLLLKRKMYVRRCAKAMVMFLALAALSLTVGYFAIEEGDRTMFDFLPTSASLVSKEEHRDPQDNIKKEEVSPKVRKLSDRAARQARRREERIDPGHRRATLQLQDEGYNNEVSEGYFVDEAWMNQFLENPFNEEGQIPWVPEEDPGYQYVHEEQIVLDYDSNNEWGRQALATENPNYQDAHKDQFDQEKHLRRAEVWARYEGTDTTTQFLANQNHRS